MRGVFCLACAILVCGCAQGEVREKYVCSDGWVTDSPKGCEGRDRVCPKTYCPDCICSNASACPRCPDCVCAGESVGSAGGRQDKADSCEALGCPAGTQFASSKSSKKYHSCGCQFALKLSSKNIVCFRDAAEAEAAGKQACGICSKNG